jgi:hypothetical protein
MKVITQRVLIREAAQRWREQYGANHRWGRDKDDVYAKLAALDVERATAADVDAIIGNTSWTEVPACDECGKRRNEVVQIGQEPDYESSTAEVCVPCLRAAIKAAKGTA